MKGGYYNIMRPCMNAYTICDFTKRYKNTRCLFNPIFFHCHVHVYNLTLLTLATEKIEN